VGARYAQALFDLAVETHSLPAIEADLASLETMRASSADLRTLLISPKFSAEEKARGLAALADKAGFSETTRKFLGLLAANRRASALGGVIKAFRALAAARRGEVQAQVVTAVPMTPAQAEGLALALRSALGKGPLIDLRVDPAILGGLKVRVGSRLYDASLKSKLDSLKFALKRA
jgi:F-type H+-transporting ATPase subunit delta